MGSEWVGHPTKAKCPVCGSNIVYNGNNFCEKYGLTCNFAMPDQYEPAGYRKIADTPAILAVAKVLGYERFKAEKKKESE